MRKKPMTDSSSSLSSSPRGFVVMRLSGDQHSFPRCSYQICCQTPSGYEEDSTVWHQNSPMYVRTFAAAIVARSAVFYTLFIHYIIFHILHQFLPSRQLIVFHFYSNMSTQFVVLKGVDAATGTISCWTVSAQKLKHWADGYALVHSWLSLQFCVVLSELWRRWRLVVTSSSPQRVWTVPNKTAMTFKCPSDKHQPIGCLLRLRRSRWNISHHSAFILSAVFLAEPGNMQTNLVS